MTIKTKLKAGLIGCGSLSQRAVLPHLSLSDCKEKIQIEAVVDINTERSSARVSSNTALLDTTIFPRALSIFKTRNFWEDPIKEVTSLIGLIST